MWISEPGGDGHCPLRSVLKWCISPRCPSRRVHGDFGLGVSKTLQQILYLISNNPRRCIRLDVVTVLMFDWLEPGRLFCCFSCPPVTVVLMPSPVWFHHWELTDVPGSPCRWALYCQLCSPHLTRTKPKLLHKHIYLIIYQIRRG